MPAGVFLTPALPFFKSFIVPQSSSRRGFLIVLGFIAQDLTLWGFRPIAGCEARDQNRPWTWKSWAI
jgi:hypothetical protein